ncbi:enolase-phosphatase E1 isoform X2 [Polyergus mexicanus]
MTSVRTCYCKQEENVSRKQNDDITDQNRHLPTAVSRRLIIKNKVCGSNRESPIRERSDEKMSKNRSMEVQSNPVLSPETSTALENAEKIMNNAKIQLMEVCAKSSLDSGNRNRNIRSTPPLDDEAEELMYIRELVAFKFYEANTSRSEANDKTSARLESRSPRVIVPRVDLSAPKFRMSRRRRRAYCQTLECGSDNRSRERASPDAVPSRDNSSSLKDSNDEDENEATTRDDCARNLPGRTSSATGRELVRARENTCEIQIGPSVHVIDRELTRQDLDDLHISPESSWCRANTATYILRHLDAVESPVTSANNEFRKIPRTPSKTLRVRLDTSQREGPIIAEAAAEATSVRVTTNVSEKSVKDIKNSKQDNGQIESLTSQIQNCIDGEEKRETDIEDTKIFEYLENATNQEAVNPVVINNSGTDNERLQEKSENKNKVKITFRDNVDYAEEEERILNKNSDTDGQPHIRNEENTIDEIQKENPSDRSKPLPDNDTSRKTGFPHRGNIASQTYRAMESSRLYQTQIDERFSNTFDDHNEQDKVLYDVAGKDVHRRSFVSNCVDDFRIIDNLNEIDLYRPRLNDLDTILLSNDRKIGRVVRTIDNFAELLSRLEFATYRDKDEQISRYVNREEFHHELSIDKDRKLVSNEPTRSLTFETELKNTNSTVSCVPSGTRETNKNSQGTSTNTMKSSSLTKKSDSCSKYSKNSVESSVFPASDTSYGSEISSRDKVQQPRDKAHLSESSIYKSDVTTFSNIAPALSSTRTELQTYGEKHIIQDNHHADAERHVMSANRLSKCEIGCSQRKYSDNVFAQAPRKDTTEAADRLIAYILQDEKQSIEKKVADTLKESTIAPVAVRKLLDNLRINVETIRNARETETLDILKNILINVQNQTDRETKESVPFAVRSESIRHSKDNSERDTRQTGSVDFAKITADKNQTCERVKDVETFPGNIADSSIWTNAIEESILQTQGKDNANDIGQIAKQSHDFKKPDKLSPETKKDAVRSTALLESPQSSKNNSEENSEAESLKQISDIRSDDDTLSRKSSENPSTRTVSVKFNEGCTMEANDPVVTIVVPAENKEDDMNNERRGDESSDMQDKDILQEIMKENTIEETHDNIATNRNESPAKISETKDDRIHLDANSVESVDEILEKKDVGLVHSSAKEVESLCATEKDIGSQHSVVEEQVAPAANSCSVDSLRDHASLTCIKNSKLSIKEVASHIEQSIIAGENDLVKDTKDDKIHGKSMTITAVDSHRDGIEDSEFLKNTKSNNEEQLNDLQEYKIDILSSSNSSVSSILLDYDKRFTNDALNANVKRIETSSETSHSEGELYMPSSCSYSLGEVRVLKKRELISDNSIDRDSNATILVTRSMLTSLNDSPMSLLTSSGCI